MLNVPKLDDLTYQALFERARAMIPTLTNDWTDFNDHDPGITTLQTFAWLCDTLNYYINATGEVHRLKYLKLLGITPKISAAHCLVTLAREDDAVIRLPRGTRLAADDTVFELEQSVCCTQNRMLRLYRCEGETLLDVTAFAGIDGQFATVLAGDPLQDVSFWVGFDHPIDAGDFRFFCEVGPNHRNTFSTDFSLTRLCWEYYDGENWLSANTKSDETCGLLQGGFITLSLPAQIPPTTPRDADRAVYLRCRLAEGCYDLAPAVGRIDVCCVQAVQTDTYSQLLEADYDGSGRLAIDYAVHEDDLLIVAAPDAGGMDICFRYAPAETDRCTIVRGNDPTDRVIVFDETLFGWAPKAGDRIWMVVVRASAAEALLLDTTDGCASQQVSFDAANILSLELALIETLPNGRCHLTRYHECHELGEATCDDAVFVYDAAEHRVTFGDSIHGVQPEAGCAILAVTAKTSRFREGNILENRLNRLLDPVEGIRVRNPQCAVGGERMQSSDDLEIEIERRMRRTTRAVTAEDIAALVKSTPGLLIDSVAVIPMKDYCAAYGGVPTPNTILVAVKPTSVDPTPPLSGRYRTAIRENLEQYRLLTTEIRVISAQYVGVSVFGRISLTENSPGTQQKVLDLLESIISTTKTGDFGRRIDFGRLFSALEMLGCVKSITQLSLEYIGAGGWKNEHGDIVLHADGLSYLRETGIEFQ